MKKWPGPSFDFTLTPEGDKLSVFPSDIAGFKDTMSTSNLDKITPEQMQEKVESIGYTDGGIEQDDFDYIMRSLVPGDTLTVESKRFCPGSSRSISFAWMNFTNLPRVTATYQYLLKFFLVGMVLLSQGSKVRNCLLPSILCRKVSVEATNHYRSRGLPLCWRVTFIFAFSHRGNEKGNGRVWSG